jgi:hypothetical protein
MPRKRIHKVDEDIALSRRMIVLKHRMGWPPKSAKQIAAKLHVPTRIVEEDIEYLKTKFTADYYAKANHSRVARAMAEMEVIAFGLLADAEALNLKAYPAERANLTGKALQALGERNRMMLESGMITKAAARIELDAKGKVSVDLVNSTVEERIAALTAVRATSAAPASQ